MCTTKHWKLLPDITVTGGAGGPHHFPISCTACKPQVLTPKTSGSIQWAWNVLLTSYYIMSHVCCRSIREVWASSPAILKPMHWGLQAQWEARQSPTQWASLHYRASQLTSPRAVHQLWVFRFKPHSSQQQLPPYLRLVRESGSTLRHSINEQVSGEQCSRLDRALSAQPKRKCSLKSKYTFNCSVLTRCEKW